MISFVKHGFVVALAFFTCTAISYTGGLKSEDPVSAPKTGFRAEILDNLSDIEKKLEDLAGAVPADKFSWRPGEGVRSVGQVYVHIVGSNYFFMSFLGVKPPVKLSRNMEDSITTKDQIIPMLKPSFDHVRATITKLSDKDLDKETKMFGNPATYRAVLLTEISHLHEHLGQSIAYARMNNVVPPWTAAAQAAAAKKGAK